MRGGDVPVADRGDGYYHKPEGIKESETFVETHEMVQQAYPGKWVAGRKGEREGRRDGGEGKRRMRVKEGRREGGME